MAAAVKPKGSYDKNMPTVGDRQTACTRELAMACIRLLLQGDITKSQLAMMLSMAGRSQEKSAEILAAYDEAPGSLHDSLLTIVSVICNNASVPIGIIYQLALGGTQFPKNVTEFESLCEKEIARIASLPAKPVAPKKKKKADGDADSTSGGVASDSNAPVAATSSKPVTVVKTLAGARKNVKQPAKAAEPAAASKRKKKPLVEAESDESSEGEESEEDEDEEDEDEDEDDEDVEEVVEAPKKRARKPAAAPEEDTSKAKKPRVEKAAPAATVVDFAASVFG